MCVSRCARRETEVLLLGARRLNILSSRRDVGLRATGRTSGRKSANSV